MIKKILWATGWMLLGAFGGLFVAYLLQARMQPPLQFWHSPILGDDFRAKNAGETFDAYLSRERALYGKLDEIVRDRGDRESGLVLDRYDPDSPSNPANHPNDWNRTFEMQPEETIGGVLLIHGLSDSPYSVRAAAEVFRDEGFYALGLRVPGHGTVPGGLTASGWKDWREAVRVAAHHVAERVEPGQPFAIFGYSNGAALAVDYTLGAMEGDEPVPTDLVFLSPALAVTKLAALAGFQRRLSALPGLRKLAWNSNQPEFDPFKYSSFPVRAGEEIYGLTSQLTTRLQRMSEQGALDGFPRVLAFQSIVDATIPPAGVVDHLLSRLPPGDSELVLFDVNRQSPQGLFKNSRHERFLASLVEDEGLPFGLTVITNASAETDAVVVRRRDVGETEWSEAPLDLHWPRGVYSLSHVAIPFPPDDPVYGRRDEGGDPGILNLGGVEARGERGLLALPMDLLMRLRYNPFFPYLEERLREEI